MIVRLAQMGDEEKISKLVVEFRSHLLELKGIKFLPDVKQGKKEFREYLDKKYPVFVAEDSNMELLGYIVCRVEDGVVWAESLFVLSEVRRNGIGSKLYEKAEEIAKEVGCDTVYNWVHPNNDKVIPFLAKRGYDVLNLVEVRKKWKDEKLAQKINVGKHEFNY